MSNLTILNSSISQLSNLYNLKDLHRVSGNEAKHEPNRFIRLDQTKDLITEIESEAPNTKAVKTLRGTQGGTYACKELVIAYAAWISPAFHLVVLRAFLNQIESKQQNLPLLEAEADEEAIRIIANLYHSLNGAYEMGVKIRKEYPHLGRDIDKFIGGHYLYSLNMPTENALEKARKYVQAKSERIMFIKGMLSLLEQQPKPKRLTNF
ncbi:KilA-N domain-containing protein [Gallibacterium anatis]|uniref:KilA-N domain-containing protein n=1 Tax=Gallibacterium anatis TaxID=750 RepID=UPI0009B88D01|nr:KilA-N domain-containing protein [Gallibacterium anatis]